MTRPSISSEAAKLCGSAGEVQVLPMHLQAQGQKPVAAILFPQPCNCLYNETNTASEHKEK